MKKQRNKEAPIYVENKCKVAYINPTLSVITLNVNVLATLTKGRDWQNG